MLIITKKIVAIPQIRTEDKKVRSADLFPLVTFRKYDWSGQ
ncbi:hypothetical protein DYBT9275_05626 [Dyadobacter sp. CECT 9275]|uniref:Uncharacterized protein n=1 Tax=Dyadobacter helix TaxID=2822344 RepID=A0A916JHU0_9BACT|nr:hypothetical protein DYBT9275_05626 [Dyadobacter sp. CECT 9275]